MWKGFIGFYGTPNLEQTHSFYADILELPLALDQGSCRLYAVPGGGYLGFCQHLPVHHTHKSPLITLITDEVDQLYQRLCQVGITPEAPPQVNRRFNLYHFFVQDPAGYTVEIQQFLDDDWDGSKQ